jgi:hypothetical protein
MASHTAQIVPHFDFAPAERLSERDRFKICLDRAKQIVASNGYQDISDFRCVPETGGSETELQKLESGIGIPLPAEYRRFLSNCRYLKLDDGREVGGLDHAGVHFTESPWVSDLHRKGVEYLVFANYWQYADGDQLMFDLSEPGPPVVAYLHEHGPLFELYAPSFSFALWRLVHE